MPQCNDHRSIQMWHHQCAVAAGSRWRGSSSPGHMPTVWTRSWQCPTPTTPRADVPSCAIAAVLVVAAGLVCCRPTIGQRGIQCGGTGGTGRASLKPDRLLMSGFLKRLINKKDITQVSRKCVSLILSGWSAAADRKSSQRSNAWNYSSYSHGH